MVGRSAAETGGWSRTTTRLRWSTHATAEGPPRWKKWTRLVTGVLPVRHLRTVFQRRTGFPARSHRPYHPHTLLARKDDDAREAITSAKGVAAQRSRVRICTPTRAASLQDEQAGQQPGSPSYVLVQQTVQRALPESCATI